ARRSSSRHISRSRFLRDKQNHAADKPRQQRPSNDAKHQMGSGVKPGLPVASAAVLRSAEDVVPARDYRDDDTSDDDRLSHDYLATKQRRELCVAAKAAGGNANGKLDKANQRAHGNAGPFNCRVLDARQRQPKTCDSHNNDQQQYDLRKRKIFREMLAEYCHSYSFREEVLVFVRMLSNAGRFSKLSYTD